MTTMHGAEYVAGFAKTELACFDRSFCLFGWGDRDNLPRTVHTPLFARAMVLEHLTSGKKLAYVVCDLLAISESVRTHVVARLCAQGHGFAEEEIALTATHTHSGPSGYSTYLLYAINAPGFSVEVHDAIVDAIVDAVLRARMHAEPARLWVDEGRIPISESIAWNRSLDSYNRNLDVTPLTRDRADEAVNRTMTVLRVDSTRGRKLGLVSWFGLHGTCVHRDQHSVHPDHKGEAARLVEEAAEADGESDFVALFAQGAAGDVTPNHRFDSARGMMVGKYDDDFASATFVGSVQARHAIRIATASRTPRHEVCGAPSCHLEFVDFFGAEVHPDFAQGFADVRTAPPVMGLGFGLGTSEGPGPLASTRSLLRAMHSVARTLDRVRDARGEPRVAQGTKLPFFELAKGSAGKLVGIIPTSTKVVGYAPSRFSRYFHRAVTESGAAELPWVPRFLPAQLVRLGPLALALLPMEPTTASGRRIATAVLGASGSAKLCVVNGYANAYAGYCATREEYEPQGYEGASTFFGPNTLGAWCTVFRALAKLDAEGSRTRVSTRPPVRPLASWVPARA